MVVGPQATVMMLQQAQDESRRSGTRFPRLTAKEMMISSGKGQTDKMNLKKVYGTLGGLTTYHARFRIKQASLHYGFTGAMKAKRASLWERSLLWGNLRHRTKNRERPLSASSSTLPL